MTFKSNTLQINQYIYPYYIEYIFVTIRLHVITLMHFKSVYFNYRKHVKKSTMIIFNKYFI